MDECFSAKAVITVGFSPRVKRRFRAGKQLLSRVARHTKTGDLFQTVEYSPVSSHC